MVGLFLLRAEGPPPDGGPLLARIEGELYALAFSDARRAGGARVQFGVEQAGLYYVCAANVDDVLRELRLAGARGFIVDYDPSSASFASAAALPG